MTITGRDLGRQAQFKPFRICDHCGGRFTVDRLTRRRQMIAIGIALVSLVLTIKLYFDGTGWLLPSLLSYVVLAAIIWHGNRLLYLVPYPQDDDRDSTD